MAQSSGWSYGGYEDKGSKPPAPPALSGGTATETVYTETRETRMSGASPRARIGEARKAALSLTDPSRVDNEVVRQIDQGLLDVEDIVEASTDDLEREERQTFRRKVKKAVEVPVMRKVKVPTLTKKVVPDVIRQRVKYKKQVPTTQMKDVQEAYNEIVEQPAKRMKELWVKKMVEEDYMKKVEVVRYRTVQVPETVYKEVEDEQEVEIKTTKVVDVPGWRIDEIKDTKLVEVEGWQEVELVPRVKDSQVRIESTHEIRHNHRRVERKQGTDIVEDTDARLDNVDTDSDPSDQEGDPHMIHSAGKVILRGDERRTKPRHDRQSRYRRTHTSTSSPVIEERVTTVRRTEGEFTGLVPTPPPVSPLRAVSPGNSSIMATTTYREVTPTGNVGIRVTTAPSEDGLEVQEVDPSGFAFKSNIEKGDVIVEADRKPMTTVMGWRDVLCSKRDGDVLEMKLRKRGNPGVTTHTYMHLKNFDPSKYNSISTTSYSGGATSSRQVTSYSTTTKVLGSEVHTSSN